jgi:hypothetical protein
MADAAQSQAEVKACVKSLQNKPEFKVENKGIYVEVAEPVDGKYSAQRFEIKEDGTSSVADDKLPANSTYYKVDDTVRGGNRKNRKSSRKNRKSSKKNRKFRSSRRSRK